MRSHVVKLLLLALLATSVFGSGTIRMKEETSGQITTTMNTIKQTKKDLAEWEKAMATKAAQKGLDAQGKKDIVKANEKMKEMAKTLKKQQSQPTPPALTEKESANMVKAKTQLNMLRDNMLKHAGDVQTAPPPPQNNLKAANLVALEKQQSALKKVEANPVTASPEMTTEKNEAHSHMQLKQYEALKSSMSTPDLGYAGDSHATPPVAKPAAVSASGPVPMPSVQVYDGQTVEQDTQSNQPRDQFVVAPVPKGATAMPSLLPAVAPVVKASGELRKEQDQLYRRLVQPQVRQPAKTVAQPVRRKVMPARPTPARRTPPARPRPAANAPGLGLRRGALPPNAVSIVQQMEMAAHRANSELANSDVVAKTLNQAADTVKSLTKATEATVEITPIVIKSEGAALAKKLSRAKKEFESVIRSSVVDDHADDGEEEDILDSEIIKSTENAVKSAKKSLKSLLKNTETSIAHNAIGGTTPSVVIPAEKKEEPAEDGKVETWFDRAKRLSKMVVPAADLLNSGDAAAPADPFDDGLLDGHIELPAGKVDGQAVIDALNARQKDIEKHDQTRREAQKKIGLLVVTKQIETDTKYMNMKIKKAEDEAKEMAKKNLANLFSNISQEGTQGTANTSVPDVSAPDSNVPATETDPKLNDDGPPASGSQPAADDANPGEVDPEAPPADPDAPPADTDAPPADTDAPPADTDAPPADTDAPVDPAGTNGSDSDSDDQPNPAEIKDAEKPSEKNENEIVDDAKKDEKDDGISQDVVDAANKHGKKWAFGLWLKNLIKKGIKAWMSYTEFKAKLMLKMVDKVGEKIA